MAIKRLTIEIDDLVDNTSPTQVPETLVKSTKEPSKGDNTPATIPTDYPEGNETEQPSTFRSNQTGRTWADLIIDFRDDSRVISTLLTVLPFVIFVTKIDSINSMKYPLVVSIILNFVWFAVPPICKRVSGLFKK